MRHGFRSLYQPIIEIRTGKILGYEALIRGTGKRRQPGSLFRHAYTRGSLIEFDLACIGSAFRVLSRLGPRQLLFVNVEPFTLGSAFNLQGKGKALLKKFSGHGRRIVFELTEGMKRRDFKRIQDGVRFLRSRGSRFAIDDVAGVGYKLIHLLTLKPDFLKIDLSLIQGIESSRLRREIVNRIIRLARKSRSHVVAEGVERRKDLILVSKMGIRYVQGFYLARPCQRPLHASEQKAIVRKCHLVP